MTDERIEKFELRLDTIDVHVNELLRGAAVDQVHRDNISGRLASIEDTLRWLVRLIGGSLILACLAFIIQGGVAT